MVSRVRVLDSNTQYNTFLAGIAYDVIDAIVMQYTQIKNDNYSHIKMKSSIRVDAHYLITHITS